MQSLRTLLSGSLSLALGLAFTGVAAPRVASADPVVIKLGTLAPKGTPWETLLKQMSQDWTRLSNGQVTLRIYAGGTLGNEGDMVKKMRVGQLQAAALTTIGLHDISPDPLGLDVPMLIDNDAQLEFVRARVAPSLEKKIEDKGFVVLAWSEIGFVRFFSSKKYESIKALEEGGKVFCWEGDPGSAEAWRAAGFHPVVISSTDIVSSLQTGMLDTIAATPLYAYTSQYSQKARFMIDTPWSPLTGAMVVKKDAWEKIPADVRAKLLESVKETGKKIDIEVRRMDAEAMKSMKAQGLTVVKGDPAEMLVAAKAAWKVLRGKVVPADTFDAVQKAATESKK